MPCCDCNEQQPGESGYAASVLTCSKRRHQTSKAAAPTQAGRSPVVGFDAWQAQAERNAHGGGRLATQPLLQVLLHLQLG